RLGSYCGVTIVLNFRFQLTLLGWEICNCSEIWFRISGFSCIVGFINWR
ncbi:hypothetical protein LINPERPRIM_LOCUS4898, partial [Linum perenne]